MGVFDKIPYNFFNSLASGNRTVYADCLILIYNLFDREISYRIPRDFVRDAIAEYIRENNIIPAEDETAPEGESIRNNSAYASFILRRFSDPGCNWLEEDTDDSTYEKHIIMSEQGIMLAEFLLQLQSPEREEFSGYIFSIYSILKSEELWRENPYASVVRQVYRNARDLSRSLKRLSTSIRKIIEKTISEESLESLTENIINYCDGSFIKEYARLVNQNNIHIYRIEITKRLNKITESKKRFELLIESCMDEDGISYAEASDQLTEMIESTRRFLKDEYDRIMADIKHKINIYMQIAVGRARFLRSRDASMRGSVETALKYLASECAEISSKDELPPEMSGMFNILNHMYIDTDSIRYPRIERDIKTATIGEYVQMTDEDIARAKKLQQAEAYNPYSKKLMKEYVEKLMPASGILKAAEMPMKTKSDMLAAVSSVAYAKDNGYKVKIQDGFIESDGLIIHDFIISKE